MARQFDNELCVFCSVPSSRAGEHVLPAWLLRMFPHRDGPYSTYVNGQPVLNRTGRPREHSSVARVKVPMCPAHNAVLQRRFEVGAKSVIRRLFASDGALVLTSGEARTVGEWFVKTWLLLAHPRARSSHPELAPAPWTPVPDDLYGWMISNGPVPDGLSLWLTRRDHETNPGSPQRQIPLPRVVADGVQFEFQSLRFGLRALELNLVYHPGWPIDHPLERDARAAPLWPLGGDKAVDLSALPLVAEDNPTWLKGHVVHFAPGAYENADLPPLSETSEFTPQRGLIQMVGLATYPAR